MYGQPDAGVVLVRADADTKARVRDILGLAEFFDGKEIVIYIARPPPDPPCGWVARACIPRASKEAGLRRAFRSGEQIRSLQSILCRRRCLQVLSAVSSVRFLSRQPF